MSTSRLAASASARSGPGHERVDRRAVQVLHPALREGVVEQVHGHADDLAGLLRDVGDAIGVLPLAEGQADGHLVHDAFPEHLLRVLQPPQPGPSGPFGEPGFVIHEADDPKAQLAMRFHRRREGLAARSGARDEDEAAVHAPCPEVPEGQPQDGPRDEGDQELRREEDEQEEAADLRQLEPEEDGEGRHGHEHGRPHQVPGLRPDRPARPRPVEAVERQGHDPADRVEQQQGDGVRDDLAPPDRPVLAEAHDGQAHQHGCREDAVGEHEQQAQGRCVAPDHRRVTLGRSGAFAQWYSRAITAQGRQAAATRVGSGPPVVRVDRASGRTCRCGHRSRPVVGVLDLRLRLQPPRTHHRPRTGPGDGIARRGRCRRSDCSGARPTRGRPSHPAGSRRSTSPRQAPPRHQSTHR